jgi:regulator of sirC expression with transglutaminase-like and TPR domain
MLLSGASQARDEFAALRAQFALPDQHVNYLQAKLAVDSAINPATDQDAIRADVARWEAAVRSNMPKGATSRQTLDAVLKTLYTPGPWNNNRPLSYDLNDPLGKDLVNKQLGTYLRTRKGNCVSMPILFVILGQRLGLTVTLATAPNHVMVKFADDEEKMWRNVEATAGGFKYDESYIRETGISEKALKNEIYLRPLLPHESIGVITSTLMEHYAAKQNGEGLLTVADMALKANPKDTNALVWKANAFYVLIQERYRKLYPKASDIPPEKVADFKHLSQENHAWFAKAEALGWSQKSPEQEAQYIDTIKAEKAKRGQ